MGTETKTVVARWADGMHFEAATGFGGHPAADGDEGRPGSRPTELLLAALAACAGMDVVSICQKKRQRITGYEVRVDGHQRDVHPRVFTDIEVEHVFEGEGLDRRALVRAIELSATRYCPVSAHIAAGGVRVRHTFRSVAPDGTVDSGDVVVTGPFGAGTDASWLALAAPTPARGVPGAEDQAGVGTADRERSGGPM